MSNKNSRKTTKRTYVQRARARRREQVHNRITLAAVELHGEVGPARTTMGEIAKRAGVRRATVYNHFPTELELIDACSSHWFGENPPPDPEPWKDIADPRERARIAIKAMYDYYQGGQEMLGRVLRDVSQVSALEEIIRRKWWPMIDRMVAILADGWVPPEVGYDAAKTDSAGDSEGQTARDIAATRGIVGSLKVALDFFTWQTLYASGLSNERAARLALSWIEAGRKLA